MSILWAISYSVCANGYPCILRCSTIPKFYAGDGLNFIMNLLQVFLVILGCFSVDYVNAQTGKFFFFLAHLSHWLMVGYCDHLMSVVRRALSSSTVIYIKGNLLLNYILADFF